MAGLMHIAEPTAGARSPPQWRAFLELAFRPLYLGGCLWATVAVALWIFAPGWIVGTLAGVAWHAHEMLWGFVATIAVGFLLTAGVNWTGAMTVRGTPLALLVACWVGARVGFLLPGTAAFVVASALEVVFFTGAAVALGRAIYRTRNRRNYGIPLVTLALGVADALFLWTANGGDYGLLMQRFTAGLLAMASLALLVARRVIPFFAMRAVSGLTVAMHTRSGHWQVAACVLAAIASLGLHAPGAAAVTAAALTTAGVIALVQLVAWKPWAVWRVPLLWILYAGYAGLGLGLLVGALHAAGIADRAAWPVHVIGVAGFSVLIIGMVTRTALGHLGRPLRADRGMVASYILVLAAAALRFVALVPIAAATAALHASALAWIGAFAIYLARFAPMLVRPRVDANPLPPGAPVRK